MPKKALFYFDKQRIKKYDKVVNKRINLENIIRKYKKYIDIFYIMNNFDTSTVVLMLDQSNIFIRVGNRFLTVLWFVVQTNGLIGFDVQQNLLDKVKSMIFDKTNIITVLTSAPASINCFIINPVYLFYNAIINCFSIY